MNYPSAGEDSRQDCVRTDSQPNDMPNPGLDFGTICEDCPPIRGPSHLETAWQTRDGFHPETSPEASTLEVGYEAFNGSPESGTLLHRQPLVLATKPLGDLVGWQRSLLQGGEELVVVVEFAAAPSFQVGKGLSQLSLPLFGPHPRLIRVDLPVPYTPKEEPSGVDGIFRELIHELV